MENVDVFFGLHDFLERMRQPTASDFVKSIKSFIVSFSNNAPDPERDSAAVQDFFAKMEAAFRAHPLWSGCSEEEIESAGEGLEKYVMTKIFTRVFSRVPDDVKLDEQLSEKMSLIQQFIRPENLDIKPNFQNETSWLLAQKELQKINMYKAPRDKLVCILNCCKVITNLLHNASIASNEDPPGADEFLPVLIFVTIKANPPQLHSNLSYIQRYRRESRLAGETAYFFTNMLSVESFISNIDAKAISMDETEFEKNMEFARALLSGISSDSDSQTNQTDVNAGNFRSSEVTESSYQPLNVGKEPSIRPNSAEAKSRSKEALYARDKLSISKSPSLPDLENKGAAMILKEDPMGQVFQDYPYLFAQVGDLTINDVDDLLNHYKKLVFKYVCLSRGLGVATSSESLSNSETQSLPHTETLKEPEDVRNAGQTGGRLDGSDRVSFFGEETFDSGSLQDKAILPQGMGNDETSK